MSVDLNKLEVTHNEAERRFETWIDVISQNWITFKMGRILSLRMWGYRLNSEGRASLGELFKWGLNMPKKDR